MKKYFLLLFLMVNIGIFAEWVEVDREIQEGMTSIKILENELQTTGLVIVSSNFDGNLSLIYLGTVAVGQLRDVKVYKGYSYGYDEIAKKFIGINVVDNSIVYMENTDKEKLIKAIENFENSSFLKNINKQQTN